MATGPESARANPDFLFHPVRTVNVTTGDASVSADAVNLVAASSRFGLVFAALDQGVKIYTLEDIQECDAEEGPGSRAPTDQCPFRLLPTTGPVLLVALSADDLTLAVGVVRDGVPVADMYDVRGFAAQPLETRPIAMVRLGTQPGVMLQDFAWNPVVCEMFAVCLSDGSVSSFELSGETLKILGKLPPSARGTCLCWSPKGKQLVVGKQDGSLGQYKPSMQEAKVIPQPTQFENPACVLSVAWLAPTVFAVVYGPASAVAYVQTNLMIVAFSKTTPVTYTDFGEPWLKTGEHQNDHFWFYHLPEWGILVSMCKNSIEAAVLGCKSTDKMQWELWELDSHGRAEVPLKKGEEAYPLGVAVSYNAQRRILGKMESWDPMPILLVLATSGGLSPFHMKNLAQGAPSLVRPPEPLRLDGQRKPMQTAPVASFSSQPSSVGSSFVPVATSAAAVAATAPSAGSAAPTSLFASAPASSAGAAFSFASSANSVFSFGGFGGSGVSPFTAASRPTPPMASTAAQSPVQFLAASVPSFAGLAAAATTAAPVATSAAPAAPPPLLLSQPSSVSGSSFMPVATSAVPPGSAATFVTAGVTSRPAVATGSTGFLFKPAAKTDPGGATFRLAASGPPAAATPVVASVKPAVGPAASASTLAAKTFLLTEPSAHKVATPPAAVEVPPPSEPEEEEYQDEGPRSHKQQRKHHSREVEPSQDALKAAMTEEIADFQFELDAFKQKVQGTPIGPAGKDAKMMEIMRLSVELEGRAEALRSSMKENHTDVHCLRHALVETFAMVEEARTRDLRNRDPRYVGLLRNRSLDPVVAHRLEEARRLRNYVKDQLQEVHAQLDLRWREHLARQYTDSDGSEEPSPEVIYQTLRHIRNTASVFDKKVDSLSARLANLHLHKGSRQQGKVSRPHWNDGSSSAVEKEQEVSSLADALLSINMSAAVSAGSPQMPRRVTLSPDKKRALAQFFSRREVTVIEPEMIEQYTESRLISKLAPVLEGIAAKDQAAKDHQANKDRAAKEESIQRAEPPAEPMPAPSLQPSVVSKASTPPKPAVQGETKDGITTPKPFEAPGRKLQSFTTSTPLIHTEPATSGITCGIPLSRVVTAPEPGRVPLTRVIEVSLKSEGAQDHKSATTLPVTLPPGLTITPMAPPEISSAAVTNVVTKPLPTRSETTVTTKESSPSSSGPLAGTQHRPLMFGALSSGGFRLGSPSMPTASTASPTTAATSTPPLATTTAFAHPPTTSGAPPSLPMLVLSKPSGTTAAVTSSGFTFVETLPKSSTAAAGITSSGFKFGEALSKPSAVTAAVTSSALKFGETLPKPSTTAAAVTSSGFVFGETLPKPSTTTATVTSSGFKFGETLPLKTGFVAVKPSSGQLFTLGTQSAPAAASTTGKKAEAPEAGTGEGGQLYEDITPPTSPTEGETVKEEPKAKPTPALAKETPQSPDAPVSSAAPAVSQPPTFSFLAGTSTASALPGSAASGPLFGTSFGLPGTAPAKSLFGNTSAPSSSPAAVSAAAAFSFTAPLSSTGGNTPGTPATGSIFAPLQTKGTAKDSPKPLLTFAPSGPSTLKLSTTTAGPVSQAAASTSLFQPFVSPMSQPETVSVAAASAAATQAPEAKPVKAATKETGQAGTAVTTTAAPASSTFTTPLPTTGPQEPGQATATTTTAVFGLGSSSVFAAAAGKAPAQSAFGQTTTSAASTASSPFVFGSVATSIASPVISQASSTLSSAQPAGETASGGVPAPAKTAPSSVPQAFGGQQVTPVFFGAPQTTTTTVTTSGTLKFGQVTTTTAAVVSPQPAFGQAVPPNSTLPVVFGGSATTSAATSTPSLFGGAATTLAATSTPSLFGGAATTSAATSTPSLFGGAATTSAATSTPSLFGGAATTSAATSTPSLFGGAATTSAATSTPSLFGGSATASAATSTPSVFGGAAATSAAASTPSLFGGTSLTSPATTSTTSSLWKTSGAPAFGQPAATAVFNQAPTSTPSVFGQQMGASAPFGQPQSTFKFGQTGVAASGANTTSPFGQMVPTSATSSPGAPLFGQKGTFGSPPGQQTQSLFGQSQSLFGQPSTPAFGQPQAVSAFGQQSQDQQGSGTSMFGGGTSGFLGGLGSKPSSDGATKNVFGGVSSFGSAGQTSGLFGNQGASSFGSSTFGSSLGTRAFSGAGSFSMGGGSVAQAGFGGAFQQQQQQQPQPQTPAKPAAFGGAPTFGGSPTFGGPPQFGGSPTFGGSPSFGGAATFGTQASPQQASPAQQQQSSGFMAFGNVEGPTFGGLAAQQQQGAQQQGMGFGSFAASPAFGGASPGFGDRANQQNPAPAFSQWRN
ncbi:nuclear pore complex protein Nup214 isoform X4 [Haemaphysalis longicornis]